MLDKFRKIISSEMTLPDIRGRHVFTAKLRIVLFLAVWLLFFVLFPAVWTVSPFVPLVFNVGFLITTLCYLHFIRYNQVFLSVMFVEILADAISQTSLVYLMGYDGWAPYLAYGLYITVVGKLTGYLTAMIASIVVIVVYAALTILIQMGILPPFVYPSNPVGFINIYEFRPYLNLLLLPIGLLVVIYSVRIANYFTQLKQNALERRNIQLSALNNIGATIRRALNPQNVIDEILNAVTQGLGFQLCILAVVDNQRGFVRLYLSEQNFYTVKLQDLLNEDLTNLHLPLEVENNSIFLAIRKNKVLVRNNFAELFFGVQPGIGMEAALNAQKKMGLKKFVITPLVAEQKVVGAIIGGSKKAFIDEIVIDALDNFANQAAMALESSQLINALEVKNKELLEANKVKTSFLAIMSHELRTPLNAVIGYTEVLIDDALGSLNPDQVKSLNEVLRNGKNLLELINDILDLAKLESGKMEINADAFDLKDLVQDIKTSLMPLIRKKEHELNLHIQDGLRPIYADALRVRQILVNLIGNSIKFTEQKGEIDVFLEYFDDVHELCSQEFPNEDVASDILESPAFVIRVRDNGIGIKSDDIRSIFELFKQADPSYTRRHEGSGLGLALTRQLVLFHKGFISVKSEYGQWTEFKVLLPQIISSQRVAI
jgi:signal transduction histidine kinase